MQKENKMAVMPIPKLVLTMSFPIMISMLVQSLYNIVDGIFVSRINENALTATSIAYSAQMLQIAVAVGTGVGVNAVVSRYLGAKEWDKVNKSATTGLFLSIISSFLFVIWGIFGTRPFIELFTEDPEILEMGTEYLQICQIFATGIFLGTITQRLLQATGRTVSSMFAQIAGAVVNIIFDPLLIFGIGFFPEMGIAGAAAATVLGQWTAALIGMILNKVQNKEILFVFQSFHFDRDIIIAIYKVGFPTILMQAIGSIMMALMNLILVMFSTTAVAFFGVYYKLQNFLFMPMNGLGQGSLPIVGYNYGAKDMERVKQTSKMAIATGALIGAVGTIVFLIIPEYLLQLFAASAEMTDMGVSALRIISITFILAAVTMITGYIISGLGNGTVNMIAAALRQIILLIPCVFILGTVGGISMVWFAFWISEAGALIYSVFQIRKYFSKLDVHVVHP